MRLSDADTFAIQRAYHDSVCSDPCEPQTWATAPKILAAVESIVASHERAAAEKAWDEGYGTGFADNSASSRRHNIPYRDNPYARQEDRNG